MISIILGIVGIILFFSTSLPLTSSKELKRPKSIYLGVIFLGLALFLNFISTVPEVFHVLVLIVVPLIAIVAAFVLAEPKTVIAPEIAEQQKKQGETFLAENKNKEGVVTLPSGLQYKVLKEGKGPHPKLVDTVLVHYKGEFIDGRVFDSSSERGKPHHFTVNQVIPGWSEALQLMNVEAKWRLFVPSYLAYGERGFQREIPPNTTLIFEMELLAINPQGDSHSTP